MPPQSRSRVATFPYIVAEVHWLGIVCLYENCDIRMCPLLLICEKPTGPLAVIVISELDYSLQIYEDFAEPPNFYAPQDFTVLLFAAHVSFTRNIIWYSSSAYIRSIAYVLYFLLLVDPIIRHSSHTPCRQKYATVYELTGAIRIYLNCPVRQRRIFHIDPITW